MGEDEEQLAAEAIGALLTTTLLAGHAEQPTPRTWLYVWEREALTWLVRFKDRRPGGGLSNAWMHHFLALNRAAILDPAGRMDFDLRAARLAGDALVPNG